MYTRFYEKLLTVQLMWSLLILSTFQLPSCDKISRSLPVLLVLKWVSVMTCFPLWCRELQFQNAFSQHTMANRLEYVHLADLGAIVNANNPTPFSTGEINWVLQVSLRATVSSHGHSICILQMWQNFLHGKFTMIISLSSYWFWELWK